MKNTGLRHGVLVLGVWMLLPLTCLIQIAQESCPGDDQDGDGWSVSQGDCDDGDPSVHPFADEVCDDGKDNDCDGKGCLSGVVKLESADAILRGERADDRTGVVVSSAGDINHDGLADVMVGTVVGAPYVSIFLGPVEGTQSLSDADITINWADWLPWSIKSPFASSAGDLNGDGYDDIIIGAARDSTAGFDAGAAYVFFGPLPRGTLDLTWADLVFLGETEGSWAGYYVAPGGDINGDGHDDILIGAGHEVESDHDYMTLEVYVLYGPFGAGTRFLDQADVKVSGIMLTAQQASPIASAGDVNGDGYGDVIIGGESNQEGPINTGAHLFYGPITPGTYGMNDADVILEYLTGSRTAGSSVAGAGDVNGDGYDDILVSYPNDWLQNYGEVYLLYGPLNAGTWELEVVADVTLQGSEDNALAGTGIAGAGDVNGDGYADVLVGAPGMTADLFTPGDDYGIPPRGHVYLLYGPVPNGAIDLMESDLIAVGENVGDQAGKALACAGDVNGDGLDDILIGVPNAGTGLDTADPGIPVGSAYLLLGHGL